MSMSQQNRVLVYIAGFAVGCLVVSVILYEHGMPKRPEAPDPHVERRIVPGAFAQWTGAGRPVKGDFIVSESMGALAADGSRVRVLVTPGLDPGTFIRVEEQWAPAPAGGEAHVRGYTFMFADRVRVRLKPGADTKAMADALRANGWHFGAREKGTDWVMVMLNKHDAGSVPAALAQMRTWPEWVSEAQADILPPPSPTGMRGP